MAEDARAAFDAVVAEMTATSPAFLGKLFSMPTLKTANGKAFAGYYKGSMVFKLAAPTHGEALALAGAQLFDPSEQNRPMREWVVVPAAHAGKWLEFACAAFAYVSGGR